MWIYLTELKNYYAFHCMKSGEDQSLSGLIRYFRNTMQLMDITSHTQMFKYYIGKNGKMNLNPYYNCCPNKEIDPNARGSYNSPM